MHLGLTHAGLAEDAEIPSAVAMGTLLAEGIGDTIRVSIAGNPLLEVEAAKKILRSPYDGILLELHIKKGSAVNQFGSYAELIKSYHQKSLIYPKTLLEIITPKLVHKQKENFLVQVT